MKRAISIIVASALLLAGCGVSPQSQQALNTAQAGCNAGDQDACTAAGYQAQSNQAEAAQNTQNAQVAAGAVGAAALLGLLAVGLSRHH
jgi:type IV secretory pathway TrbL component